MSRSAVIGYLVTVLTFFAVIYAVTLPSAPNALEIPLLKGRPYEFRRDSEGNSILTSWGFYLDMPPGDAFITVQRELAGKGWEETRAIPLHTGRGAAKHVYGYSHVFETESRGIQYELWVRPLDRRHPDRTCIGISEWKHWIPPVWERFDGRGW